MARWFGIRKLVKKKRSEIRLCGTKLLHNAGCFKVLSMQRRKTVKHAKRALVNTRVCEKLNGSDPHAILSWQKRPEQDRRIKDGCATTHSDEKKLSTQHGQ
eukprot:12904158-Prorocentrum_lima.AAC.1